TAAHCLVAPRTGKLVRPETVHFLLAYDRGSQAGHARAVAYQVAPGYRPAEQGPRTADWALLTLDAPLGTPDRVLPVLREAPPPGAEGRRADPARLPPPSVLLPLALQPVDTRVRQAEMMADLVDQHIPDQAEQVLPGLDPFQQDGLAEEQDGVRRLRHVQHA